MTAEAPTRTVKRFAEKWNRLDYNSLLSEFVSVSKETNREPDSYHFGIRDNILIDPNTDKPVLDFIADGIEKKVASDLQEWASSTEEGMALWVSPKLENKYPCPKVIIHKIAYQPDGTKVVLNSVILFDAEIENPNYKRKTLYTLPDSEENIFKILSWIKRKSTTVTNFESTEKTSVTNAKYFADQVRSGVPYNLVIDEMQRKGFLGENSISCPPGTIMVFGSKEGITYLDCECPFCHKKVKAEISNSLQTIKCPECKEVRHYVCK